MTTTEARAALIAHDPTLTYCITEQQWYYSFSPKEDQEQTKYMASCSLLDRDPPCEIFYGNDLETVVEQLKNYVTAISLPIPPLFSHANH